MPIYPFSCDSCQHAFEVWQKMNDIRPTECPSCGCSGCLTRNYSCISAIMDSSQPKTIGDLANKNTEEAVKNGTLDKSVLNWEENRRKKKEGRKKMKRIATMTSKQKENYIMTGKLA